MSESTITTNSIGPVQDRVERRVGASIWNGRGTVHRWRKGGGIYWYPDCTTTHAKDGEIDFAATDGPKCKRCFPPLNQGLGGNT